ncbi:MAG: hypothetical protein BPH100C_175 [Phage 5P_2]|nr:MAG: hypothetical protein BPH100C_175 [Phage 5P_2]
MAVKIEVRHNLSDLELAKSLATVALAEDVAAPVMEILAKSWREYEIPDRYMREIVESMTRRLRTILEVLGRNLEKWFAYRFRSDINKSWLRKSPPRPPLLLSQAEIDELKRLIELHFKKAMGLGIKGTERWNIPKDIEERWKRAGIILPAVNLSAGIQDAYIAGRLYQVLRDGDSYEHMKQMARQLPMTRADQLAIEIARGNAATYITGYGEQLAKQAETMVLNHNKRILREIITKYLSRDLRHMPFAPEGLLTLNWAELKALPTDKIATSWRQLATEIYNAFRQEDPTRDWHRVAVSETRYSQNLGTLQSLQESGVEEIYYLVQPDACKHCKALYLEPDGVTPKIFKLKDILQIITITGGMNVGRKASKIGDPDEGWMPGALVHPWCRCRPRPVVPGMKPISLQFT